MNATLVLQNLTAPMFLEVLMLLCFGLAWPIANLRMLRRREAEGKGMAFTTIILCGYVAGAASKLLGGGAAALGGPLFWLYVLNLISVAANLCLQWYFAPSKEAIRILRPV